MKIILDFELNDPNNYSFINKEIYEILRSVYNIQVYFADDKERQSINFELEDSGIPISYSYVDRQGTIKTEGNAEFNIEIVKLLFSQDFFTKVNINLSIESDKIEDIKNIKESSNWEGKYSIEDVTENKINIIKNIENKIDLNDEKREFTYYEFKDILTRFRDAVKKTFDPGNFFALLIGAFGFLINIFTNEFRDNIFIKGEYLKSIAIILFIISGIYLLFYLLSGVARWIKRLLNKELCHNNPEEETKRIFKIK